MNTEAFHTAVEEIMREARAYSEAAAAVVPPENRTASAACLLANGFDLEV